MKKESDIFTNVEYMIVSYGSKVVETFEGKDIEGKSKTDLQYLLGSKYGEKNYHYSLKIKGKLKNETGGIRGVVIGAKKNEIDNMDMKEITELRKELNQLKNNSNLDMITKLIEQKHEIEIKHLNEKISNLTKENKELETLYNELVKEVEKNNTGNDDLLSKLIKFLPMDKILSTITPGANLANNQDKREILIHPDILQVMNKVDYAKLSDAQIKEYSNLLNTFVNQLPLKG